jgi:hypothetical protein
MLMGEEKARIAREEQAVIKEVEKFEDKQEENQKD